MKINYKLISLSCFIVCFVAINPLLCLGLEETKEPEVSEKQNNSKKLEEPESTVSKNTNEIISQTNELDKQKLDISNNAEKQSQNKNEPNKLEKKKNTSKDPKTIIIEQIIEALRPYPLTQEEKEARKLLQKQRLEKLSDSIAEQLQLTESEKQKLKDRFLPKENSSCPSKIPPEVKEALLKQLNFSGFIHDTAISILASHFNKDELKTILQFLRSKTGRKLIKESPDMAAEAFGLATERYLPIIIEMGKRYKNRSSMTSPLPSPEQMQRRKEMLEQMKKLFEEQGPNQLKKPNIENKDEI